MFYLFEITAQTITFSRLPNGIKVAGLTLPSKSSVDKPFWQGSDRSATKMHLDT